MKVSVEVKRKLRLLARVSVMFTIRWVRAPFVSDAEQLLVFESLG